MSSFVEELLPETLVELVEYDHVADFVENMEWFPHSDWVPAYKHYRFLLKQGTPLHDQWYSVFLSLRKRGCV